MQYQQNLDQFRGGGNRIVCMYQREREDYDRRYVCIYIKNWRILEYFIRSSGRIVKLQRMKRMIEVINHL